MNSENYAYIDFLQTPAEQSNSLFNAHVILKENLFFSPNLMTVATSSCFTEFDALQSLWFRLDTAEEKQNSASCRFQTNNNNNNIKK